ncbi:MAG: hypothetical protein M3Z01_00195, partial [Thermoproteota archaeon]|nr:hypothetical protein [Thermoproteota archaeon]
LQTAKDNSKHISNLNVNAAKTFEQNTREVASAVKDANTNVNYGTSNSNSNINTYTSNSTTHDKDQSIKKN